jgi:hypothetical protein
MIAGSCHCGAVRIEVEVAPDEVTDCNCSICRRLGALWAYYPSPQVRIAGEAATVIYTHGPQRLAFHHCRTCGCTTHWRNVDPARERMGVNARLLEPEVIAGAPVRHFDGAAWM